LTRICELSTKNPIAVLIFFFAVASSGFLTLPWTTFSTDLVSDDEDSPPVIRLTRENYELFGEQDALIVALEFAKPPGAARLILIQGLGEALKKLPGVQSVTYRVIDPDNPEEVAGFFRRFLLGMTDRELAEVRKIFTVKGIADGLRRSRNRLFLADDPDAQKRILDDPLGLGRLVADSLGRRSGATVSGDIYLLLASPDRTMYLIQVTPAFPTSDTTRSRALLDLLRATIPVKIMELLEWVPGDQVNSTTVKWHLTGKAVFEQEAAARFSREVMLMLLLALGGLFFFLLLIYLSWRSVLLLLAPVIAALGANCWLMFLSYDKISPIVLGTAVILLGMGTDFGVLLWARLRRETEGDLSEAAAVSRALERTGPPVVLTGLTGAAGFLSLCFCDQPAMSQFGYVSGCAVILALVATLFLFPAFAALTSRQGKDWRPSMRWRFKRSLSWFLERPLFLAALFPALIVVGIGFGSRLTLERDPFKVLLPAGIKSLEVVDRMSAKFQSNFSQPTFLSFDVENLDEGVRIQREVDGLLEKLIADEGEVSSFDSISRLATPLVTRERNIRGLADVVASWKRLRPAFLKRLALCDFSPAASRTMLASFDSAGRVIRDLEYGLVGGGQENATVVERSRYQAEMSGKHRFLTKIRYTDKLREFEALDKADAKMVESVRKLPVDIRISGPRQALQALVATLRSEALWVGFLASITVLLLSMAMLRSPLAVALSAGPAVGAFCVTLGILGFLRIRVPFSIIAVAPLVLGVGIHGGIQLVMGRRDEERVSVVEVMGELGPPVIVTGLTTVIGFLSMAVSSHYVLAFLGRAMAIGIASALALTMTTLPAMLLLLERRVNNHSLTERSST